MTKRDIASAIVELVSLPQAVALYSPYKPRHNRIPCPIHDGENYNLSFNKEVYYCFKCHDGGNVIRFVMHTFDIGYAEALEKLNEDFKLGLPIGRKATIREARALERSRRVQRETAKRSEAERLEREKRYWDLVSQWIKYDNDIRDLEPSPFDDEIEPGYVEALQRIDYTRYLISELESEIYEAEKNLKARGCDSDDRRCG